VFHLFSFPMRDPLPFIPWVSFPVLHIPPQFKLHGVAWKNPFSRPERASPCSSTAGLDPSSPNKYDRLFSSQLTHRPSLLPNFFFKSSPPLVVLLKVRESALCPTKHNDLAQIPPSGDGLPMHSFFLHAPRIDLFVPDCLYHCPLGAAELSFYIRVMCFFDFLTPCETSSDQIVGNPPLPFSISSKLPSGLNKSGSYDCSLSPYCFLLLSWEANLSMLSPLIATFGASIQVGLLTSISRL